MSLLSPRSAPWRTRFERRHAPLSRSYGNFRQCLRWEFGFTCCICLTHEADLFEHGTEKTALIHIEHRQAQSASPAEANLYDNCLLVCRLCNVARGALPVTSVSGVRLLSPVEDTWVDHFVVQGDRLVPQDGDLVNPTISMTRARSPCESSGAPAFRNG